MLQDPVRSTRDDSATEQANSPNWRRILKRGFLLLMLGIVGAVLTLSALLFVFQRRLIYFPTRYDPSLVSAEERGGVRPVLFNTSQGEQVAFYLGPRDGSSLTDGTPLWVMFHGNASVALDWLYFLENYPGKTEAFLLVDYPGYGSSSGRPTAETIRETVAAALPALANSLDVSPRTVESNLGVYGYSIGCAAALELAVRLPVRRIVLMAPFGTLKAVARTVVGWPLCELLRDRFDNESSLRQIAARPDAPLVHVFHGTDDPVVPIEMGRQLAAAHPGMIHFHEVPAADHETIFELAMPTIRQVMQEAIAVPRPKPMAGDL